MNTQTCFSTITVLLLLIIADVVTSLKGIMSVLKNIILGVCALLPSCVSLLLFLPLSRKTSHVHPVLFFGSLVIAFNCVNIIVYWTVKQIHSKN